MDYGTLAVRYLSERERERIASLGVIEPLKPIVRPNYLLGLDVKLPEFAAERGLFAIDVKELAKWQDHEYFPDMWRVFLKSVYRGGRNGGLIALEFEVQPQDDFYVLDWSPVEWELTDGAPSAQAWLEYFNSRTRFADYKGEYELPELVTTKSIPASRIKNEFPVKLEGILLPR